VGPLSLLYDASRVIAPDVECICDYSE